MYWQLQIATQPIRSLHILGESPTQVAVNHTWGQYRFYDLETGADYGTLDIDMDVLDNDVPEERRENLEALKAPNQAYLPFVDLKDSQLHVSLDGNLRLIHDVNAGLTLELGDQVFSLDVPIESPVLLANLDRDLGTIVALTSDQQLYIFQQQSKVNVLKIEDEAPVGHIFVATGGGSIAYLTDRAIKLLDSAGSLVRKQDLYFNISCAAQSPDANWLLVGDSDHQLLRLYNRDLVLVRQQHAVDLISMARPVQLFVNSPANTAPLSEIDIRDDGTIVLAMAGLIATSHIDQMNELPQPRLLL